MAYTKAGVTPDGTSTYFVARHIGVRRMLDLTLTNRVLSAHEAEAWGLVNRVVPDDEVDAATAEIAQSLADGPSWALGHAKQIVYAGFDSTLEQAGEVEGVMIAEAMGTHDGQEGELHSLSSNSWCKHRANSDMKQEGIRREASGALQHVYKYIYMYFHFISFHSAYGAVHTSIVRRVYIHTHVYIYIYTVSPGIP